MKNESSSNTPHAIWSISAKYRGFYVISFLVLFAAGFISWLLGWDTAKYPVSIPARLSSIGVAAATLSFAFVEVYDLIGQAIKEIVDKRVEKATAKASQEERERLLKSGVPTFLCPIWGTPATLLPTTRPAAIFVIDSQRAGGKYEISLQLLADIVNGTLRFTEQDREVVTQWLADQRAASIALPVLTANVVRNLIRSVD